MFQIPAQGLRQEDVCFPYDQLFFWQFTSWSELEQQYGYGLGFKTSQIIVLFFGWIHIMSENPDAQTTPGIDGE